LDSEALPEQALAAEPGRTDTRSALQHVTASPGKIGQIARAALVLVLFEHKMLT